MELKNNNTRADIEKFMDGQWAEFVDLGELAEGKVSIDMLSRHKNKVLLELETARGKRFNELMVMKDLIAHHVKLWKENDKVNLRLARLIAESELKSLRKQLNAIEGLLTESPDHLCVCEYCRGLAGRINGRLELLKRGSDE